MRTRTCFAGLTIAALAAVAARTLDLGGPWDAGVERLMIWYGIGWAVFALAALSVRLLPVRPAIALTIVGAAALQIVAVSAPPTTTDDFYRYLWDGKVQAAGISPYRYVPLDPALKDLRDPLLFPAPTADQPSVVDIAGPCDFEGAPHDCTPINRPWVNTIYPPVSEAAFLLLHWLSPDEHRILAAQIAMAALAMMVLLALLWVLRRTGRDPRLAAVWGFCPMVWLEAGNNAHVDVLGILLLVLTFGVLAGKRGEESPSRRRAIAAGVLFGAAVATKLIPALVAPALLGRRAAALSAAALGLFALVYLPHVAAVGTAVLGYLPGYLDEEGYSGESRFGVPRLFLGETAGPIAAYLILAAVALLVWRQAARRPAAAGALLVVGTTFVVIGPNQPWYGLLIVALGVLAGRPEWLAVAAAAYPVYHSIWFGVSNTWMQQRTYLPALVLVLLVAGVRAATQAQLIRPPSWMTPFTFSEYGEYSVSRSATSTSETTATTTG